MIKKNNGGDYMKNKENILIGLLVVVIVVAGFVFFRQEKALNELTETIDETVKQEVIKQEEASDLEFKKALEEQEKLRAEEGKLVFKLAYTIEVDKENQDAKVLISNSKYAKHNIGYELYLGNNSKDAQKLLYSNEIKPGETVDYVKLNKTLEPGKYEGRAKIISGNDEYTRFPVTIVVK